MGKAEHIKRRAVIPRGLPRGSLLRSILTMTVFLLILGGFFILCRAVAPPQISQSERRPLVTAPPEVSLAELASGGFMNDFETFAADSFAFRDRFRTLRAIAVFDIFRQTDKSGLYYTRTGSAGQLEQIDTQSVRQVAAKINRVAADFAPGKRYYSFVPDKSIYAGRKAPGFDAEQAREILAAELTGLTYIDLVKPLQAGDFYRTDLHWDQSRLSGVLSALGDLDAGMGFFDRLDTNFTGHGIGYFQGVYTGQLALPLKPDLMTYLTCEATERAVVRYLNPRTQEMEPGDLYNVQAFDGRDPYDLFLNGAQPLIILENPSAATDRSLYLFRDSFYSSLAPLLLSAYADITLVDLRYIDYRTLTQFLTPKPDADVLFLYSSQILNHATTLLVNPS